MNKKLFLKTRESLSSVLPITAIVLLLNFTIAPMPFGVRSLFLVGAIMLILGMGLFTLGADVAMMPMGEQIGSQLTKSRKLLLLISVSLFLGVTITIAEPDLQVLANQVPSIPNLVIILAVALGVGLFLVLALLRILFQWRLSYLLVFLYAAVFLLALFVSDEFSTVAFDSGGVTTGPITVPFILALGIGISSVRGGKSSHDDSFGLVALCSIGPIIAVMLLGIFYQGSNDHGAVIVTEISTMQELFMLFRDALPVYARDVAIAISPVLIFFGAFQLFALKLPSTQLIKMIIGIIYTYAGLVLFLTGVNVGFMPAGNFIGNYLGGLSYNWILIPLGAVMGYFVVYAEPAVHVLNDQVEDMTGGAISKSTMRLSLSIGVAISLSLAMVRVITGVKLLYFLLPGYAIALILTFFVPKIFTAIAFDSGGVASGPMTATFLLPFAMGACTSLGGNLVTDAFGVVAMVAMTPLITIQVMGVIYKIKVRQTEEEELETMEEIADDIIDENEAMEWFSPVGYSEVSESYDWVGDTEFIENYEWANELKEERLAEEVAADNDYIDFEEFEKYVLPEDFDAPKGEDK